MWTFYAMGLNPRAFKATEASLVQNQWEEPDKFPKMIWPTNYSRLACQVAFTLFTAGSDFAPKAIIDGKNIQDYLQDHLLEAMRYFYRRIFKETDLANRTIIGVETLNELNHGLVGWQDIGKIPQDNSLKLGTTPTAFQGMLLGSGIAQKVDVYEFRSLGPAKSGTQVVDPEGVSAWLPADYDDSRYGWHRDPGWELGRCIWAQHGVWDDKTHELLNAEYFRYTPEGQPLDHTVFNDLYFTQYWNKFYMGMREVDEKMFLLCQPPVLTIPPELKNSPFMDARVIYAPHYYDGLTLINKHWNRWWNVDVLGILRGRYSTPALAIKVGESAIRNCLRDQLAAIKQEGLDRLGPTACLMTETGMPFDLDNGAAYASGDYSGQESSWDALGYALEGAQIHHTLWTYCSNNTHARGDGWNGEDFSIYSLGSMDAPDYSEVSSMETIAAGKLRTWLASRGTRATEAIARPFPLAVAGTIKRYGFTLKSGEFKLEIDGKACLDETDLGTEIVVPAGSVASTEFDVDLTSGGWEFDEVRRVVTWWHDIGPQTLTITAVRETYEDSWWSSPSSYLC